VNPNPVTRKPSGMTSPQSQEESFEKKDKDLKRWGGDGLSVGERNKTQLPRKTRGKRRAGPGAKGCNRVGPNGDKRTTLDRSGVRF